MNRLVVLQNLVAELELEQKRLNQKNYNLENHKEKLKRDRNILRDTLRQVYAQTCTCTHKRKHIYRHTQFLCVSGGGGAFEVQAAADGQKQISGDTPRHTQTDSCNTFM